MSPGERLWRDSNRVMRRQQRRALVDRIHTRAALGWSKRREPADLGVLLARLLTASQGRATPGARLDGLRMPAAVAALQQQLPRRAQTAHRGCCHCAFAAARQVARAGSSSGGPKRKVEGLHVAQESSDSPMFDAHAHLFGATNGDLLTSILSWAWFGAHTGTATFDRIGWLAADMADAGIDRMAISGFFDSNLIPPGYPDWVLGEADATEVDLSVWLAALMYPDFFAPLVNGFRIDAADPVHALKVQVGLPVGWRGIGEIIVHGHGTDHDKNEALFGVLAEGVYEGLPVCVHWDIGAVDMGGSTAEANFDQLSNLLDHVPDAVVVLAHCGLGPWQPEQGDGGLDAWAQRLVGWGAVTGLLSRPNVYFDLGGMQVVGSGTYPVLQLMNLERTALTTPGRMLLDLMGEYPERFMLGTDVETRSFSEVPPGDPGSFDKLYHFGVEDYAASVQGYRDFLQLGLNDGSLSEADAELILHANAEGIYGA